jgi:tetratricopeptide (TPR) repeat protein
MSSTYKSTFIASPASDALFLIGIPVLALGGVMLLLHFNVVTLTAFIGFTAIFTGAHHLPGFMRAYGTRDIFQANRGRLLLAPLLIFSLVLFLEFRGLRAYIVVLWFFNWWHTAMQNYGLLRIYDRKALPPAAYSAKLDLISIVVWHFTLSELLADDMRFELARHLYNLNLGDAAFVSAALWGLRWVGIAGSVVLLILYVRNTISQFRVNATLAINKQLFLVLTYGVYAFMFRYFTEDIATSVESFYHNTQYLFFVWIMQRRLSERGKPFNWAGSVFSLRNTAAAALAYLLLIGVWGYVMGGSIKPRIHTSTVVPLFNAFYATAAFLHYYTDSFIWKARSREMSSVLGLKGAGIELSPRSFGFSLAEVSAWILVPVALAAAVTIPSNRPHDGVRDNAGLAAFAESVLSDRDRWPAAAVAPAEVGDFLASGPEPRRSIAWYQRAIAAQPGYADAYQAMGHIYSEQQNFAEAAAAYEKAVALDPNLKATFNNLGNAYNVLGEFQKATAAYGKALALDGQFKDALLNLAALQASQGDLLPARVNYEKVLLVDRASTEALRSLGQIAGQQGRFEEAADYFRRAIDSAPQEAENFALLAKTYLSRGILPEAEENLTLALSKDARFTEARFLKSQMLMKSGRLDDAAAILEEAIRIDPDNPEAHANLGSLYRQLQRYDLAVEQLQAAVRIDPNFADAYYELGEIWDKRGDRRIAAMYLNQALRLGNRHAGRRLGELNR